MVVIGIDLGTTYSCVAAYVSGKAVVIPNEEGERTTPSAIIVDNRVLHSAKRLIGRTYDPDDARLFPFEICDMYGKAGIRTPMCDYLPEQISAVVLKRLVLQVERRLNKKVTGAVITVPAYFNDAMRNSTKYAAEIAGIPVLRLLNEPTAAAIAYGLDIGDASRNILVFDLGGGTLDVSLLNIDAGVFEVLATAGDTRLGGEDFNNRLLSMLRSNRNIQFSDADHMRYIVERAKCELSESLVTTIDLEGHRLSISRETFETLCGDIFRDAMRPVDQVMNDAQIRLVDEVVLIGGSTRIPKIREMLKIKLGRVPDTSMDPDTTVACGAAIQAGILSGEHIAEILLLDIIPISLSLETYGGVATRLLARNSRIPQSKSYCFYTTEDNQAIATIRVFEGERPMTRDNRLLGQFDLGGIPPRLAGEVQIQVTYSIDCNGVLTVSAKELVNGHAMSVAMVDSDDRRLSRAEISNFILDAEANFESDKDVRIRNTVQCAIRNTCYGLRNSFKDGDEHVALITPDRREVCLDYITWLFEWIDANPDASSKEYRSKEAELKYLIDWLFGWKSDIDITLFIKK